jgi:hypothetical protein
MGRARRRLGVTAVALVGIYLTFASAGTGINSPAG